MTINEKIHTTLTYKEVVLIAVALNRYRNAILEKIARDPNGGGPMGWRGHVGDTEMLAAADKIVNRLTDEIYSYPKFNFTIE
jgi:hypothetical protein